MARRGRTFRRWAKGKRSHSWAFVIDVAPYGAPRKQLSRSGFSTRREAEEALQAVQRRLNRGEFVEPSSTTLQEFVDGDWKSSIDARVSEGQLRESTRSSYRSNIRLHVLPYLGERRLQSIGRSDIEALKATLLTVGRKDAHGGLSPASTRYVLIILGSVLSSAVDRNLLPRNPAENVSLPSATSARPQMNTWTAAQVRAFLEQSRTDQFFPIWHLAAMTGMRRGELLGLRWTDVDLRSARVSIRQTLISVEYGIQISTPKTAAGTRVVALDTETVRVLKAWRASQAENRLRWGSGWIDSELVFTRDDGRPLHPDRISKLFDQLVRRLPLPLLRLHDLRHSHASILLAQNVHPKVVSERLGHSSIELTLRTYSHVIPPLQESAAAIAAQAVFGP